MSKKNWEAEAHLTPNKAPPLHTHTHIYIDHHRELFNTFKII